MLCRFFGEVVVSRWVQSRMEVSPNLCWKIKVRDPFRVGKKTRIMINASFIDIYGIHDRFKAGQLLIRAKNPSAAGITKHCSYDEEHCGWSVVSEKYQGTGHDRNLAIGWQSCDIRGKRGSLQRHNLAAMLEILQRPTYLPESCPNWEIMIVPE